MFIAFRRCSSLVVACALYGMAPRTIADVEKYALFEFNSNQHPSTTDRDNHTNLFTLMKSADTGLVHVTATGKEARHLLLAAKQDARPVSAGQSQSTKEATPTQKTTIDLSKVEFDVDSCQIIGGCRGCEESKSIKLLGTRHNSITVYVPSYLDISKESLSKELMKLAYDKGESKCRGESKLANVCILGLGSRTSNLKKCLAGGYVSDALGIETYYNTIVAEIEKERQRVREKQAERDAELWQIQKRRLPLQHFLENARIDVRVNGRKLMANPFVYQGKVVLFETIFSNMVGKNDAMFALGRAFGSTFDLFFVSGVPTTRFSEQKIILLAARVVGQKTLKTPSGGESLLMNLEFIDAYEGDYNEDDLDYVMNKPTQPSKGDTFRNIELVDVPGGCYQMGSPDSEPARANNERQHEVCVKDFKIGKYEVTLGQFRRFVESSGYRTEAELGEGCYIFWERRVKWAGANWRDPVLFQQTEDHPVICVTWNDATAYAEWLSRETGRPYRLPTEAEWEYACRSGGKTELYCGGGNPDALAWYDSHRVQKTQPVGRKDANSLGLHDMSGNVWEWTCSIFTENFDGNEKRCVSKNEAINAKIGCRGGSWRDANKYLRSGDRGGGNNPTDSFYNRGFRLVQEGAQ